MADKVAEALYKGTRREGFGRNGGHLRGFGEFTEGVLADKANLVAQALMAPGNALQGSYNNVEIAPSGTVTPFDPALMQQATNMAGLVSMSSLAAPKPSGALTAGFSDWFGGSKVVDEAGAPLTVYHGTGGNFDQFDLSKANSISGARDIGFHFGSAEQANTRAMMAADGGNVMPVKLSLKNPVRLPDLGYWSPSNVASELLKRKIISYDDYVAIADGKRPIAEVMKQNGYDGIVYKNAVEGEGDSFIALEPTQIKSATGNSGAYNPADPNITRAAGVPIIAEDKRTRR